jgi:hypothetical protein
VAHEKVHRIFERIRPGRPPHFRGGSEEKQHAAIQQQDSLR